MPRPKPVETKPDQSEDWPLTASQIRELNRRVDHLKDRTRFLLVSPFTRRFVLYYDVSRDVWGRERSRSRNAVQAARRSGGNQGPAS
jgi:hypothetical protein